MARPMSAAEYDKHRRDEIDGALRLHKYHGLHIGQLPQDIASPEFTEIANRGLAREKDILAKMGVRRLAPAEGPQLKRGV